MTVDFTQLDPGFVVKVQSLLNICQNKGYNFVPRMGFRSLEDENKFWRQSRPTSTVIAEIAKLRAENCDYLADSLENVGPQPTGKWETNTIGGLSWHNWGQALDVLCQNADGSFIDNGDDPCYEFLSEQTSSLGMKTGLTFNDAGHIQMNPQEIPEIYTLKQVNDYFSEKNAK